MFKTPYETTTLSNYQLASTRAAVEQAIIENNGHFKPLIDIYSYANEHVLTINDPTTIGDIPVFSQPLLINTDVISDKPESKRFVIDCRNITDKRKDGSLHVSKYNIYKNHLIGAALSNYWFHNGFDELANNNKLSTKVFANWVTGVLTRRLNLDELAQVRTNAIVAYYFLCLFENYPSYSAGEKVDDDKLYTMAIKVAYATGLKTQDAVTILSELPTLCNINDLSTALRLHGGSDRYRQVNTALIYSLLGRTGMFGITPETIVAALEYPPLFMGMVYIAASDRGYNKSDIGNIVHLMRLGEDVKHYVKVIDMLLGEY